MTGLSRTHRCRSLIAAIVAAAISASGIQAAQARKLVLESFFHGPLLAQGYFANTRDGSQRHLTVRMNRRWYGRALVLVEDFAYADGERDPKTWTFTKIAEGHYVGQREDVIGRAEVYQDGEDVRLRYVARIKAGRQRQL